MNENNIYTIFKEGGAKLCISAMKDFINNEKVSAPRTSLEAVHEGSSTHPVSYCLGRR